MTRFLILTVLVLAPASGFAAWGGDELKESTEFAFTEFEKNNQKGFDAMTGFEITLKASKIAAKATFTYLDAKNNTQTKSYTCHTHGNHIDCH